MWVWGVIIAAIIGYSIFGTGRAEPISGDWNMVEQLINDGEVERIKVINKNTAQVYLTDEAIEKYRTGDEQNRLKNIPKDVCRQGRLGHHPRCKAGCSRLWHGGQPRNGGVFQ